MRGVASRAGCVSEFATVIDPGVSRGVLGASSTFHRAVQVYRRRYNAERAFVSDRSRSIATLEPEKPTPDPLSKRNVVSIRVLVLSSYSDERHLRDTLRGGDKCPSGQSSCVCCYSRAGERTGATATSNAVSRWFHSVSRQGIVEVVVTDARAKLKRHPSWVFAKTSWRPRGSPLERFGSRGRAMFSALARKTVKAFARVGAIFGRWWIGDVPDDIAECEYHCPRTDCTEAELRSCERRLARMRQLRNAERPESNMHSFPLLGKRTARRARR